MLGRYSPIVMQKPLSRYQLIDGRGLDQYFNGPVDRSPYLRSRNTLPPVGSTPRICEHT